MVTARTSRLSLSIMRSTSRTSDASNRLGTSRTLRGLYALERVHDLFVHDQALGAQRLDGRE